MPYIDTKYLGKCETCRHCKGEIKCDTFCDAGEQYIPDMSKIPTADVVEVDTIKAWLYGMAINNVGCVIDGDFSNACEEIIARLDGLRNFAKERGVKGVKYCRYCSFCILGDCYYCTCHDKTLKRVDKPTNCEDFAESELGDVETGKRYKPRAKKAKDNALQTALQITEGEQ